MEKNAEDLATFEYSGKDVLKILIRYLTVYIAKKDSQNKYLMYSDITGYSFICVHPAILTS